MRKFLAFAFVFALGGVAHAGSPTSYRVIVNEANPVTSVSRRDLSDLFLKKTTRWDSGEAVRAVDLRADSAIRSKFSDDILGRPVSAIKGYWQASIFSGRDVPPPEVDTEADVVRFVKKNAGAVGYVSANADITGTTVLTVK